MSKFLRWGFTSAFLMLVLLTVVACGGEDAPAAVPTLSSAQPSFIFFFTEP